MTRAEAERLKAGMEPRRLGAPHLVARAEQQHRDRARRTAAAARAAAARYGAGHAPLAEDGVGRQGGRAGEPRSPAEVEPQRRAVC